MIKSSTPNSLNAYSKLLSSSRLSRPLTNSATPFLNRIALGSPVGHGISSSLFTPTQKASAPLYVPRYSTRSYPFFSAVSETIFGIFITLADKLFFANLTYKRFTFQIGVSLHVLNYRPAFGRNRNEAKELRQFYGYYPNAA